MIIMNGSPVHIDDDDYIVDDEEDLLIDDGELDDDLDDCAYTPEEYWFCPHGGLTGAAYDFLATTDLQGEFV